MRLLNILALVIFISVATAAKAEDPVMVIRFNDDVVEYQNQLNKVVQATLDAKPTAFFDIVTVVPDSPSSNTNKKAKKLSVYYTNQIAESLQASGISTDNIRITYQDSKLADSSEVNIFVR